MLRAQAEPLPTIEAASKALLFSDAETQTQNKQKMYKMHCSKGHDRKNQFYLINQVFLISLIDQNH